MDFFAVLFLLFAVHRAVVFETLLKSLPVAGVSPFRAFLVGIMSDYWVAVVFSLALGSLSGGVAWALGSTRLSRIVFFLVTGMFGVLAAGHTAYVDFFRMPIIPFHLRYLGDDAFISANALSLLGVKELGTLLLPLGCATVITMSGWARGRSVRFAALAFLGMVTTGLLSHNRNIHFREQWFVPESLQVSPLERLYIHFISDRHPVGVSATELANLQDLMNKSIPQDAKTPWEKLLALLTDLSGFSNYSQEHGKIPIAEALRGAFQKRIQDGRRPIILVTLLESMRPAEAGYFQSEINALPSLTPNIDKLVEKAIVFHQAYSTGSVTRGGQEAVLCGYLGSRDTSLMRGTAATSWDCLPKIVSEVATTFWYHGGEGLFDQQEAFWWAQGVHDTMSLKDFSSDVPKSSWGIGDLGFFQAVVPRLERLQRESTGRYLLGMALTLTNHIPWDLPPDAPSDLRAKNDESHPSYRTTSYADFALGDFVKNLKKASLWKDVLMVVVSDHGNRNPPYNNLYKHAPTASASLDSHVQFFLIGGITEEALAHHNSGRIELGHFVSQADVASLISDIIGVKNKRLFGSNPFEVNRRQPVLSILEEQVFAPAEGKVWGRGGLNQGMLENDSKEALKAQLYYRAFMEFAGMPTPKI